MRRITPRSRALRPRGTAFQLNMTPLIDVTFLLLTYFMLASHYASAEKPDMLVPNPDQSQAIDRKLEEKIIINALYKNATAEPDLTFGAIPVASLDELIQQLQAAAQRDPAIEVVLRADRRVRYGQVRKIMEAISAANLVKLQVVAELGETP
jgi:biopolymer transport protein ExbD/biopolymer transport protein TolR